MGKSVKNERKLTEKLRTLIENDIILLEKEHHLIEIKEID